MSNTFAIIAACMVVALHIIPAIIHHRNVSRRAQEVDA